MKRLIAPSVAFLLAGAFAARADIDLNGTWEFAFADKTALEEAAKPDFTATDMILVADIPSDVLHDGWNLVELVNRAEENLGEWRICWTEIDVAGK